MMNRDPRLLASAITLIFLLVPASGLSAPGSDSFLPTWKLLNNQEKQQFISGYIRGWQDAQKVTEVATGFIKENPEKAVESLESINRLYDVSLLKPEPLVREIDRFYQESENRNASLSAAVTAAKSAIQASVHTRP
ncbi:MAG: hypothetical protein J5J00_02480 [Deltaproteobacteria bacterium]|nr:hypothetical protein [Deltaproteobacteria bacterium]